MLQYSVAIFKILCFQSFFSTAIKERRPDMEMSVKQWLCQCNNCGYEKWVWVTQHGGTLHYLPSPAICAISHFGWMSRVVSFAVTLFVSFTISLPTVSYAHNSVNTFCVMDSFGHLVHSWYIFVVHTNQLVTAIFFFLWWLKVWWSHS